MPSSRTGAQGLTTTATDELKPVRTLETLLVLAENAIAPFPQFDERSKRIPRMSR